jgi:hypothetical protein
VDLYDALASKAIPVSIEPGSTSYFSKPQVILDPRLFRDHKLIPSVRESILVVLFEFLGQHFSGAYDWAYAWLAGSGVSHQWAADRTPGDLDCLVGIQYDTFRASNTRFVGLSNQEIASMINQLFKEKLWPETANFMDSFELTFYVNVQTDITKIKPYAAYSLTSDSWSVEPTMEEAQPNAEFDQRLERDKTMAAEIVARYGIALTQLQSAKNTTARVNAERALKLAISQATALFDDIHGNRTHAFSQSGSGYLDYNNYRWQEGKASGVVQALGALKDLGKEAEKEFSLQTYGMELPDVSTLIRRAIIRDF